MYSYDRRTAADKGAGHAKAILTAFNQSDASKIQELGKQLVEDLASGDLKLDEWNWHPVGFGRGNVGSYKGRTVRLHLYPENLTPPDPELEVHEHLWGLRSCVLAGKLTNRVYKVRAEKDPDKATHQVLEAHCDSVKSDLHPTGKMVYCESESPEVKGSGTLYEIPDGTYHTTRLPKGQFAATLVATGKVGKEPNVLGPVKQSEMIRNKRPKVSDKQLSSMLKKLQGIL